MIEPYFFKGRDKDYHCGKKPAFVRKKNYMAMRIVVFCPGSPFHITNSLKTEIVFTYNMREWRHFFRLRADKAAHPQMRQVAIPPLLYFQRKMPALFDDIDYDRDFPVEHYAQIVMTDEIFNPLA